MKEYKIVEVSKKDAEATMNEMAHKGWEVVSTNYWSYWTIKVMIVFAREV